MLEVNLEDARKASSIVEALSTDAKPKRAKVALSSNGPILNLSAVAEDDVAMRSVINSYIRLIDVCLKVLGG